MADNVVANAGSGGATFATDDIAGVHYPITKLAYGALDSVTLVSGTAGLPVTPQGTFTVDTELPAAAALVDNAANPTTALVGACGLVWDGTDWSRLREVVNGLDSAGQGIAAAALVGQLDDVSTSVVTENQFAAARISSRRALLVEGVASGTAVAVSGTVTANAGSGTFTVSGTVDTELPAAAALADGAANPTAPQVGGCTLVFNGTTWDRARGDTANGLDVDVTRLPALPAGTNNIGDVDVLTLPGVAGDAAHDAADAGNPLKVGGRASEVVPTAVSADGDRVNGWFDRTGRQVTTPYAEPSAGNSSTTTLGASGVFTGTSDRSAGFGALSVAVFASHASAANGLSIQQSQDGSNWDTKDVFDVPANEQLVVTVNLVCEHFRVVYTNGGTAQTTFRLEALKSPYPVEVRDGHRHPHSRFAVATLTATTDAAIVAAPGTDLTLYVRSATVTNTSATLTRVDLKDGTTTKWQGAAAASGGGFNAPWKGLLRLAENAAFNGALGTAVTDVRVSVEYAVGNG